MRYHTPWGLTGICAACALGAPAAAQTIDGLSDDVRARSGRLIVSGSGFGSGQGRLLIDGREAIVTRWSESEIHGYVPEASPLGAVGVVVATRSGDASEAAPLEVVARNADGRIEWFFEMDRWMTRQFVAAAADGTVYVADQLGLYALSRQGALLWFHPGAGGVYPIAIGADGTIYAGPALGAGSWLIRAINPDGSTQWEFRDGSPAPSLHVGPSVGPDGHIYGAADRDTSRLGVFSIDPTGALRWEDEGDPELWSTIVPALTASEFAFSGDDLYFGWMHTTPTPETYKYDLNGNPIWFTGREPVDEYFFSFPRVDPSGRPIGRWGQTGLIALRPDGTTDWIRVHPSQTGVRGVPAIGPDGVIYTGASRSEMWAVNPDGSTRWVLPRMFSTDLIDIGIAPDGSVIVAEHLRTGEPTAITGHDPADGSFEWLVELEEVDGETPLVTSIYPEFTPDSRRAYVTTSGGPSLDYSRVYAIRLGSDCPADFNGDGVVNTQDVLAFLNAWTSNDSGADFNGDGVINTQDVLAFLNAWTVGC